MLSRSLLRANSTPEYLNGRNGTEGETALITACRGGRLTAATVLLLEAGACMTMKADVDDLVLRVGGCAATADMNVMYIIRKL